MMSAGGIVETSAKDHSWTNIELQQLVEIGCLAPVDTGWVSYTPTGNSFSQNCPKNDIFVRRSEKKCVRKV